MKRTSILLLLFIVSFLPMRAAGEYETQSITIAKPKAYILTHDEYRTLRITDMDGKPIKNFRIQKKLNSNRDEYLGLSAYNGSATKVSYPVVRPVGGKAIRSISWVTAKGELQIIPLNGRTVADYWRDPENLEPVAETMLQIIQDAWDVSLPVRDSVRRLMEARRQDLEARRQLMKQDIEARQDAFRQTQKAFRTAVRQETRKMDEPLAAPDAKSLYAKWSEMEGVSATYISPAMFKMIRKVPQLELDRPVDITPIVQSLDGLYMLEFAEQTSVSSTIIRYTRTTLTGGLRKDISDFLDAKGYETLMEKRAGGQVTRLYSAGNDKTVTGFMLVRLDADFNFGQVVCLEGKIPRDQFEKIITAGIK